MMLNRAELKRWPYSLPLRCYTAQTTSCWIWLICREWTAVWCNHTVGPCPMGSAKMEDCLSCRSASGPRSRSSVCRTGVLTRQVAAPSSSTSPPTNRMDWWCTAWEPVQQQTSSDWKSWTVSIDSSLKALHKCSITFRFNKKQSSVTLNHSNIHSMIKFIINSSALSFIRSLIHSFSRSCLCSFLYSFIR